MCKFEINWSTNKNLKSAYNISWTDGLTDGCPAFPYPPLHFEGVGDKNGRIPSLPAKINRYTSANQEV
jgi:hypothetical protein